MLQEARMESRVVVKITFVIFAGVCRIFMRNILMVFLLAVSLTGTAQKPQIRFTLEGLGDNREFHNGKSRPQTILGTLGSFRAGTTLDGHSLFAGISHLFEFGSEIGFHQPRLILYYGYDGKGREFRFGSFPRRETVDFPLAMLADTLLVYRPQIEGLSGKLYGDWGYQMAFVDWTGRQTETVREAFMAGTSGELKFRNWFLRNYLLLDHLAHTSPRIPGQHIKDHLGYGVLTGVRMGRGTPLTATLMGGVLSSIYRERSVTDGFNAAYSFHFEGNSRYRNLGLQTTLHSGDPLQFAHGDPFYQFGNYLRTDAVWYFINHKNIKGRFNWSLHWVDFDILDQSQQLTILCSF